MKSDWVLQAANVGCIYEGNSADEMLGVLVPSLCVPAPGITVILGGSGSGKSTLLGLLTSLQADNLKTDNQKLLQFQDSRGKIISLLKGKRPVVGEVAFVFQDSQLIKTIDARSNAELGARVAGEIDIGQKVERYAEDLGVERHLESLGESLSGGQAQRIAVIRALSVSARLLICDEPTSSLDHASAIEVMNAVRDWAEENEAAVLWVTHDRVLATRFADYLLYVYNGRLIGEQRDDGVVWPFHIQGYSDQENLDFFDEIKAVCESEPAYRMLTQEVIDAQIVGDPVPYSATRRKTKSRILWNPLKWISNRCFLVGCGIADLFVHFRRARRQNISVSGRWLRGMLGLFSHSLPWVFLLGLVVFFSLDTARYVADRYMQRELRKPEISHFTFTNFGGSTVNLNPQTLKQVEANIARQVGQEASVAEVYGRRTVPQTDMWLPNGENCDLEPSERTIETLANLRVYQSNEPLYDEDHWAMSSKSGATISTALLASMGLEKVDSICLNIYGPTMFNVAAVADEIPGSGRDTITLALPWVVFAADLYKRQPRQLIDRQNKFQLPSFTNASLYFRYEDAERVFCIFKNTDACAPEIEPTLSGFKLNSDILEQIKRLLRTSRSISNAFFFLTAAFALTIGIAIGLSIKAYVDQNQKSIAIMKAFGYDYPQVLLMLVAQAIGMIIVAFVLFVLFGLGTYAIAVPNISRAFDLPVEWLLPTPAPVAVSLLYVCFISITVAVLVLGIWWSKRRYLGSTLQAS